MDRQTYKPSDPHGPEPSSLGGQRPTDSVLEAPSRSGIRLLSRIKNALITPGPHERTIQSGAFRGLRMQLDLAHHTQNYLGLYERELHAAIRTLSAGVATAIDVGSSDGSYALFFLARTAAARVLAFDPDPSARATLRENLALNGFASCERLALYEQPVGTHGPGRVALDDLLSEITTPVVVKVDAEGAEAEVLRGATALIRRGGVGWLIETHSRALEADCLELLRGYGYDPRIIMPAWWRVAVPEARPIPHNQWIVAPAA